MAGGALTADAFHVSAPDLNAEYAAAAIRQALSNAGVTPEQVDYICAHGTATRANDRGETAAIHAAFGSAAAGVAVSSPKSMVGHLIGAAGALGVMVCALAIRDGVVPPARPPSTCTLPTRSATWTTCLRWRSRSVATAVANAFGFGGQNCVAVFTAPR